MAEHDGVVMIVVASHVTSGWRQVAFVSIAQKVAEQATCPVMVLRLIAARHSTSSAVAHV
jgi:nucleotide-binding universal stress UspA family protein